MRTIAIARIFRVKHFFLWHPWASNRFVAHNQSAAVQNFQSFFDIESLQRTTNQSGKERVDLIYMNMINDHDSYIYWFLDSWADHHHKRIWQFDHFADEIFLICSDFHTTDKILQFLKLRHRALRYSNDCLCWNSLSTR